MQQFLLCLTHVIFGEHLKFDTSLKRQNETISVFFVFLHESIVIFEALFSLIRGEIDEFAEFYILKILAKKIKLCKMTKSAKTTNFDAAIITF